ncbi:hypothetical protein LEN26_003620 [Aphanomyces euteiches]|nr:hypothetical protein LEN26_003620 [Aphanomyces euteiches]
MLTTIQSEKSETTIPSDRDNIFRLIQDEVGFTKLDRMVFETIEKWVFRRVEKQIIRATSLESKALWLVTKAELTADIGQIQEAASASQEAYDIYREINDDTLSDMWMALAQLAVFLRDLGHSFEEVESMFVNALTHLTGLLTKKHVNTLGVMSLLGQFYMFHGKYYSAEPVLMECFELRRQVLGEDHLGTRVTMSNISTVMRYQKRYEEALQWAQRCYDIECRVLGADHPESYRLRNEMGLVYRTLGHFDLAEEHLNNACPYTLGENYRLQGKYSEAEEILLRCLKEDDANMRTKEYCNKMLGLVYVVTQDLSRARTCLNEALKLLSDQGWSAERFSTYVTPLFTLKMQSGEFEHLEKIDAFEKDLHNAKSTQDVWMIVFAMVVMLKSMGCSMHARNVQPYLCTFVELVWISRSTGTSANTLLNF